jgi:hypothetical protein
MKYKFKIYLYFVYTLWNKNLNDTYTLFLQSLTINYFNSHVNIVYRYDSYSL